MDARNVARLLLVPVLACAASLAHAQVARQAPAGGGNAQVLQQAMAEKAALQSENSRLKQELEAAKSKAAAAGKEASGSRQGTAALRTELAQAQAARQAAEQAREQTQGKLQELLEKYRGNTGTLAGLEVERGQLRQDLGAMAGRLDVCAQRNVALHDTITEALDKVGKGGFFKVLGRSEPFTRIERVRLDNLVEEYRARVDELKLRKAEVAGPEPGARAAGAR